MTNWKEYKLGDLVAINERSIGKSFDFKSIEYIDTSSVTENRFDAPTYTTISEAPSRAKRLIADGDTIISTVRPIQKHYGFIKNSKPNQVVSTGFAVVTPKRIEPRFLYYFLTQAEITEFLNTIAEGGTTTFPAFKADELKDLPINLPDLPTQTAIAEILSSLDDKIELNNLINQELENLAQTLFKQWFIDFEFPANLADDTLSGAEGYKSSGGVMVDSELGEIPKGWEVKKLNEFVNCYDSKRVPLSSQQRAIRKGSYPYYGAASLMDYVDDYLFDGIYVLMGEDGSVTDANGYPVLQYVFGQFWVNNHAHVLQGTTISTELVMCLLKSTNISHLVTGAVQPKLNQGNMNKISLAIPDDTNILKNLEINIKSIYESVRNNTKENQELTNLRDTLLPKLISGELEVADIMAEKV